MTIAVGGARLGRLSTLLAGNELVASMPTVWDSASARRIPGVGRALGIYTAMLKQAPLDLWRGVQALPRPRLLDRPDPTNARSWFVQNHVEDYLLNGNAIHIVTARGWDNWPLSVAWVPVQWCSVLWEPGGEITYWIRGQQIPTEDVVHVKRGADRNYPVRGVGVVEEYLDALDRIGLQERYERSALNEAAVPSVAVIAPNPDLSQVEADAAKVSWLEKFGNGKREPAILPNGTQVIPLGWSPSDNQLIEARRMSLQDVANMFNLDGYWVGAPTSSQTYRSPGPMYLNLLRTSIEPVAVDFEDEWSDMWVPATSRVRFDRQMLLRDDLQTTAETLQTLTDSGIMSILEARQYLALPVVEGEVASVTSPVTTV